MAKKICPNTYEHEAWTNGRSVLGMDEAGRGPLAGPLSVAGVIFPIGYENPEIYDSKALSEKKREALYDTILEDALWAMVIEVKEADIDHYNIYRADQLAMEEIAMAAKADVILSDAMPLPDLDQETIAIIKGDQKSISIAAASILAKVTRDRIMKAYDAIYPGYGFARNKGYGTKEHLAAIEKLGITPIHRRSFAPVMYHQTKLDLF
ncbi:MAG: ribonuclease HII [Lactimicrobium sp.]|jgi:ribonuclease HII|uniref:ribonuclease HII n=1 Tax=Lactimicrobium sp. TaxID=2563780 RepID=UPI002F359648